MDQAGGRGGGAGATAVGGELSGWGPHSAFLHRLQPGALVNGRYRIERTLGVPAFVEYGILKAMEKSKEDRFVDAAEMASFFGAGRVSLASRAVARLKRGRARYVAGAGAIAVVLTVTYFGTYGSMSVNRVETAGSAIIARNHMGRELWRHDFSPYGVRHAYSTTAAAEELNDIVLRSAAASTRVVDTSRFVVAFLFSQDVLAGKVKGGGRPNDVDSQYVVLDARGNELQRTSLGFWMSSSDYGFSRHYTVRHVDDLPDAADGERQLLVRVGHLQMYPSALFFLKGLRQFTYTNPGEIERLLMTKATPDGVELLLHSVNNLLCHLGTVTEIWLPDQRGPSVFGLPAYDREGLHYHSGFFQALPWTFKPVETKWDAGGLARFRDGTDPLGVKEIVIGRDGSMTLREGSRTTTYKDDPATINRAMRLYNSAYQARALDEDYQQAFEYAAQAAKEAIRNPFLRSAIYRLKGQTELGLGRLDDARATYDAALDLWPGNNDAMESACEVGFFGSDPLSSVRTLEQRFPNARGFWGFSGAGGIALFKGYVSLQAGQFSQAEDELSSIFRGEPNVRRTLLTILDIFRGEYDQAIVRIVEDEDRTMDFFDPQERDVITVRVMLLADRDLDKAREMLDGLRRAQGMRGVDLPPAYLLARAGKPHEAREQAMVAFEKALKRAVGDFDARLWLFFDAYVYGKTMELCGDRREAHRGYEKCVEANRHTELAGRSRQAIARLGR